MTIEELLKQDQELIKDFQVKNIVFDEFKNKSLKISSKFLKIIKSSGFPKKGDPCYKEAITLALHLPLHDLESLFRTYIEKVDCNQIDPDHKIIFIDKIEVLYKRPQLYGTQYKKDNTGIHFLPIKDVKRIENRRAQIGASTWGKYKESIQ